MAEEAQPPLNDSELGRRILRLLRHPIYWYARKALIRYEVVQREVQLLAITELRDTLDHLAFVCKEDATREQQEAGLTSAEEHLRRAAVETLEMGIETRLANLIRHLRFYWISQHIYPDLPPEREVHQRLRNIQDLLMTGREKKSQAEAATESVDSFISAYKEVIDLRDSIRPSRRSLVLRITFFIIQVGIIVGIGTLVTWLILR